MNHLILAAGGTFDSGAVSELFLAVAVILGAARILGEIARAYNRNTNGTGSSSSSSDNSFRTVVDRFERIQLQK